MAGSFQGQLGQAVLCRESRVDACKTSLASHRSLKLTYLAIGVRKKCSWGCLRCENQEDLAAFPKKHFRSADTSIGSGQQPEAH